MAVTLVTFIVWKRTQVFRNGCALARRCSGIQHWRCACTFRPSPSSSCALPFLMLFMAGISADLLESRYALAANAVIFGVLIANCHDRRLWAAQPNFPQPIKTLRHLKGWNKLKGHAGRKPIRKGSAMQEHVAKLGWRFCFWNRYGVVVRRAGSAVRRLRRIRLVVIRWRRLPA